jgi:hypothetical protein
MDWSEFTAGKEPAEKDAVPDGRDPKHPFNEEVFWESKLR